MLGFLLRRLRQMRRALGENYGAEVIDIPTLQALALWASVLIV